jgi:hypothetical protein
VLDVGTGAGNWATYTGTDLVTMFKVNVRVETLQQNTEARPFWVRIYHQSRISLFRRILDLRLPTSVIHGLTPRVPST